MSQPRSWPEGGSEFDDDYVEPLPSIEQPFHVGQVYEDTPAAQLKCKHCGGVNFHAAQGSYFTALRCPTCLWEVCVHDG